jgi:hypothetical protein
LYSEEYRFRHSNSSLGEVIYLIFYSRIWSRKHLCQSVPLVWKWNHHYNSLMMEHLP